MHQHDKSYSNPTMKIFEMKCRQMIKSFLSNLEKITHDTIMNALNFHHLLIVQMYK